MTKENAQLWVDALRSGIFPRTFSSIHNANGYNALGVLAEVLDEGDVNRNAGYVVGVNDLRFNLNFCARVAINFDGYCSKYKLTTADIEGILFNPDLPVNDFQEVADIIQILYVEDK